MRRSAHVSLEFPGGVDANPRDNADADVVALQSSTDSPSHTLSRPARSTVHTSLSS